MWVRLIVYILVAYGISFMLVYSNGPFHIFEKIRKYAPKIHPHFEEMLSCMFCTPTWVGFGLSIIDNIFGTNVTPFHMLYGGELNVVYITMLDMVATASSVYLIDTIQNNIEGRE